MTRISSLFRRSRRRLGPVVSRLSAAFLHVPYRVRQFVIVTTVGLTALEAIQALEHLHSGDGSVVDAMFGISRSFAFCASIDASIEPTCIVSGDTFRIDGMVIGIADIDAPELSPSRCDHERQLGERAKARLRELLSTAPFRMGGFTDNNDKYGRKLRLVLRLDGTSIGSVLVLEGLARTWDGSRHNWCS